MSNKRDLQIAEAKLLDLEKRRAAIDRQMRGWIQVIEGLRVLVGGTNIEVHTEKRKSASGGDPLGLADKVRSVLQEFRSPIGATQIRDNLIAYEEVDAAARKNLLINIHTTLRRLIKTGEVKAVPLADGTKLYEYVSRMERALEEKPFGAPTSISNSLARLVGDTGEARVTLRPKHFETVLKAVTDSVKSKSPRSLGEPPEPPK